MTMLVCMDQLVQATRTKIQDVRGDNPGRPIILVGFNTGAAIACQVILSSFNFRVIFNYYYTSILLLRFPFSHCLLLFCGKDGTDGAYNRRHLYWISFHNS